MNLITEAFADTAQVATNAAPAQSTTQSLMSILPMIVLLVLFMYFMVIRPQSKRAKEHKNLVGNLQKGDEVITVAGVLGKIEKITDDFIVLNVAENTNITIQRGAVSNVVPRGTMKTV
ncbi:MAG: preprotein translocase subunit YajC [uncultured bacterium]|nr:MAG: preprotein translocase subunit YajC [uncultured bacterium]OGT09702.1 MAG: preprotein translocase subunit YajC [Gammaproteobacteria bacterium RBG_16_37_9]HBC72135.1 preprotein translocase subunit YajC [Coxiellaceae bacterium]HBS51373.1 preprotein translocase subunit YajC [Coxiellaceae bacterium]HBY55437.1 preprotein translocase subunit YajC [Coxiellaceae bacterium]